MSKSRKGKPMGEWLNSAVREIYDLPVITRAQLSPAATFLVFDPVAGGLRQINKSELKYGLGVVEYLPEAAIPPHTGTTDETTLATVTIPGGLLKASSAIEIETLWSFSGTGDVTSAKVVFGGTDYVVQDFTTNLKTFNTIFCNNSLALQKAMPWPISEFGKSEQALVTSAVNTASDVAITFKATLSNAGGNVTLEGYRIVLRGV